MAVRKASHAGKWYPDEAHVLSDQLNSWLHIANTVHYPARAIIVPHAGYAYSGSCAAYAYRQINPDQIQRIIILGPSHYANVTGCALSSMSKYQTPLYDIDVDTKVNEYLQQTGKFQIMESFVEEEEHSIEMQLPYIAKVMQKYANQYTIVPVLVGVLNPVEQETYGRIFAQFLLEPSNLFIISSDFCHWGPRFQFTHYDESCGEIHKSIEALDYAAMDILKQLSSVKFRRYLSKLKNTICGRYPILVLLKTIEEVCQNTKNVNFELRFLNYQQSSKCTTMNDSSVSYAAASVICK
ncbi:hypothetical protein FQA39_LY18951 [Lamprigera yunnana]|nr:hypothetical protein FQA39_LY18951 [Lamprigera yunnana]